MLRGIRRQLIVCGVGVALLLSSCGGGEQTAQPTASPASVDVVAPTPVGADENQTAPALAPPPTPTP